MQERSADVASQYVNACIKVTMKDMLAALCCQHFRACKPLDHYGSAQHLCRTSTFPEAQPLQLHTFSNPECSAIAKNTYHHEANRLAYRRQVTRERP